jgi:hypothetical protein
VRGTLRDLLGGLKGLATGSDDLLKAGLGGVLDDLTTPAEGLRRSRFRIATLSDWVRFFGGAGTDFTVSKLRLKIAAAPFWDSGVLKPCGRAGPDMCLSEVLAVLLAPLVCGSTV